MPRPKSLDPGISLHTKIPESLHSKLTLLLWSELENRVPAGAYQSFICSRIREFLDHRRLDLAPYGFPPGYFVSGPPEMIDALERKLKA